MTESAETGQPDPSRAPTGTARTLLIIAAIIVLVEASVFLILAALDLRDLNTDRLASGIGIAVLLAGYAVAQMAAVYLLLRGRAGARAPLIVTQVLQVLVATNLRDEPSLAWGVGLPAVVVLAILLSPPVNRALSDA